MADEAYFLNTSDVRYLRDSLKSLKNRGLLSVDNQHSIPDTTQTDVNATSAIYVARVPYGGLPALLPTTELSTYTGTGTDIASSLETFQQDGIECQIYQLSNVDGYLIPVPGLTHKVYNICGCPIIYNTWVLVKQDRYGTWWVDSPCDDSCQDNQDTDTGTGTGTFEELDSLGGGCELARINSDDCLEATLIPAIDPDNNTVILRYDVDVERWVSDVAILYPLGSGFLEFFYLDGRLRLLLDSKELLNCADDCWLGSWLTGHVPDYAGTSPNNAGQCDGYVFKVCLECTCCPIDGWQGAGYYCIKYSELSAGTYLPGTGTSECFAAQLYESDKCDTDIEICSGPYATEELAIAACDPTTGTGGTGTGTGAAGGTPSCCPARTIPTLTATLSGGEGTMALPWDGTNWTGSKALSCGETLYLRYAAAGCGLDYSCDGIAYTPAASGPGTPTCGPPFNDPRTWDCDMDDTLFPGCSVGGCGIISATIAE